MKKFHIEMAVATQLLIVGGVAQAQTNPGVFFDFNNVRNATNATTPEYTPMPHMGHDQAANSATYQNLFTSQIAAGKPTALYFRNDTVPINGSTTLGSTKGKYTLNTVLGWATQLDWVLGDIERGEVSDEQEMTEIVDVIRADSDPDINDAYIGNYDYFAGTNGAYMTFPGNQDTTVQHNIYINSGVNVSQPAIYPYSYYMRHSQEFTTWPVGQRTPNQRAALLWAPLEKFSTAKRNLPAGHKLVPYTSVWLPMTTTTGGRYDSVIPEKADAWALIQHCRLRGADGIFDFRASFDREGTWPDGADWIPDTSWLQNYSEDQYRIDIVDKWNDLDSVFTSAIRTNLNADTDYSTDKATGLYWSGVRSVNTLKILVSNLSGASTTLSLTPTGYTTAQGIPAATTSVANNTHTFFTYTITNLLTNGNFNTDASGWLLRTGTTRETTGGVSNGPCLRMQGNTLPTYGLQNIRTERGAKMSITVTAKGASSPILRTGYYIYDAAGTNLGFQSIQSHTLTSSYATFTDVFNVTSAYPTAKYIRPVINSTNAATDSTDVIWMDDVIVKFEA
jgi:hypothetical protein